MLSLGIVVLNAGNVTVMGTMLEVYTASVRETVINLQFERVQPLGMYWTETFSGVKKPNLSVTVAAIAVSLMSQTAARRAARLVDSLAVLKKYIILPTSITAKSSKKKKPATKTNSIAYTPR